MTTSYVQTIEHLVREVTDGELLLPEMQRDYVWKSTQVRDLFDSLYRGYPSGQLLVWETDALPQTTSLSINNAPQSSSSHSVPKLLLDGQQRLTSLTAIVGNRALTNEERIRNLDIVFNVHNEKFDVALNRHLNDPNWVSLRKLYSPTGYGEAISRFAGSPDFNAILQRLQRLEQIKHYQYNINKLDKTMEYEEVTEIFVRINSGGTRLNAADLSMAQLSSRWRGITDEFNGLRDKIKKTYGYDPDYGLLVRGLALFFSGQSRPLYMFRGERKDATVEELKHAWSRFKPAFEQAVQFLVNNCSINFLWMLSSPYVMLPLAIFFNKYRQGTSERTAHLLQRWVYLNQVWSIYSGSLETKLDQDVRAIEADPTLEALLKLINDRVGERPIEADMLKDQRSNSPFMLLAYVLVRRNHAQDWFNGVQIGTGTQMEFHHIFPKALLVDKLGYRPRADSRITDQVANLAFLSMHANRTISKKDPSEYLPTIDQQYLVAQSVPTDASLWQLEKFEQFVARRRQMLADAINRLLGSLTESSSMAHASSPAILEQRIDVLEYRLRELVAARLTDSFGDQAWDMAIPTELRRALTGRISRHINRYPFADTHYATLADQIANCLFSDYIKIMRHGNNWALFEEVFGVADQLIRYEDNVREVRNAFAHQNPLNDVQLLNAEAGLRWFEQCLDHNDTHFNQPIDEEGDVPDQMS